MKIIYFVGDVVNNTGPAIVNKSYEKYLNEQVKFCYTNNKVKRLLHFLINLPLKKHIIISGFSKLNYYIIKICKFFHKNTIYLMHGYIKLEYSYKKINDFSKINLEKKLLYNTNKIICVSKFFCDYMKKELPDLKNKFDYVNNGIDFNFSTKIKENSNPKKYIIISVGGGSKQKNNLIICKAIKKIGNPNVKYIVIGKMGEEGNFIKKYDFVEYYESLTHEEVLQKMTGANLYIQNSFFETFGLAASEAFCSGCDLLLSKNMGFLDVVENLEDNDIINNCNDIKEIVEKIKYKIIKKSNLKLNNDNSSWKSRSNELLLKIGVEKYDYFKR